MTTSRVVQWGRYLVREHQEPAPTPGDPGRLIWSIVSVSDAPCAAAPEPAADLVDRDLVDGNWSQG
jgi:hypothetical protein